jgi:RNA polymerase sigma-70 factor (ECF subfamily)
MTSAEIGVRSEQERKAFRDGLVENVPHLRAYLRMLTGKADIADDITQETLLKAIEHEARFRPGTNLKAWLFVIARNEFYSQYRRNKTRVAYAASEQLRPDTFLIPEAEARLDLEDLLECFAELSAEQRETLTCISYLGYTYDETAEIAGVAVGTVKSRACRGRAKLMRLMEGHG